MSKVLFTVSLALALAAAPLPAWQAKAPQTKQGKSPASSDARTFSGVIDQREGDFVISDAENLKVIAVLEGVGFEKNNFARFVGMPVEVRGVLLSGKTPPVLQVRTLDDIRSKPTPAK